MKTKEKIIHVSIDLFNKNGVVPVTTNHIAKELKISPGNLYFHFRNKEEIIRQIFSLMCRETYQSWRVKKTQKAIHPLELIERNFELFWKYRFFHREMYFLRRRDSILNKMWFDHLAKIKKMMVMVYKRWLQKGWVLPIQSKDEIDFMATILLTTATNFLHFFVENTVKPPTQHHMITGKKYVAWLLMPWTRAGLRKNLEDFVYSEALSPPRMEETEGESPKMSPQK